MSVGLSLIFLGVALAGASFGGGAVLRRLGEGGPSCALSATAGALALTYGTLAVLPRPDIPADAMLPLLVITSALGVGWTTDTASMRLPHTTANTTLAVVSAASFFGWQQITVDSPTLPAFMIVIATALPTMAGVLFAPPTTRSVVWWYLLGTLPMVGCALVASLHPDASFQSALGLLAVFTISLTILVGGRILVWTGQAGGGDPVWIASSASAAAAHAVLSAGRSLAVAEAILLAVMGTSIFFIVGGSAALSINATRRILVRSRIKKHRYRHAKPENTPAQQTLEVTLAGQWCTIGMIGFVIIWKFTPLGFYPLEF